VGGSIISAGNRIAAAAVVLFTVSIGLTVVTGAAAQSGRRLDGQTLPQTKIVKAKVKRQPGLARFRFTSSEPGSTFSCKLDDHHFRGCASPVTYRDLKDGRHTFKVRATCALGAADPTSARRRIYIGSGGPPFPPLKTIEPAHMLSGDDCDFISPEVFWPVRNGWSVGNRGRSTLVCAGGVGDNGPSTTGRFLLLRTNDRWATQDLSKVDVPHAGALKITKAPLGRSVVTTAQRHGNLRFKGTLGVTGVLHLKDDSVTLDP
jgi:hypothetical protein